ncbi:MAG: DUF4168 domain-containing protein [Alphaproteobacteria bacterium]|nr:DUF4168 domain-containing protein [Alphaproteobacteria bacterium]
MPLPMQGLNLGVPDSLAAAALAVALVVAAPAVDSHAQTQVQPKAQTQPKAAPAAPSADISDAKLDATAAAMQQVETVKKTYQAQIEKAAPADKERITGEANSAAVKAVTDQGLSVEEYTAIIQVAQNNPAVRQKLIERIRAKPQ